MNISELLRNKTFWFIDFLKGSPLRKNYEDVKFILENFNSDESIRKRNDYLNLLLNHAVNTTPYYTDYKNFKSILDFPVIDKSIIRQNSSEFLSTKYENEKLYSSITSGSTGTPFKIFQDKNKKIRNTADVIYFGELAKHTIGEKLIYLKIWNNINKKNKITLLAQNIIPQQVTNLSDENIEKFISLLGGLKTNATLLGYSSALEAICRHIAKHKAGQIEHSVKSVITMSESLSGQSKELVKKIFSAPVFSRYSNMENGIIAQQCESENNEFHINSASYYLELLNIDNDNPADFEQPGRIVITDLFNFAMPFIRYDTGDIGIISEIAVCKFKTPVFKKIEGRRMDQVYNTKGELVSSFTITNNMWKYLEIEQYQFVQTSQKSYRFILNCKNKFLRENELINEFKDYFGSDANIEIEYVVEIPLLQSGKRKKVMNLMNTSKT